MVKKENTPFPPHSGQNPAVTPDKIQHQLLRILDSPDFQASKMQRKFLQFVVAETIAGRDHEIKGFSIATQVFGRKDDFDQATDPIVSIQANKLRRALERYYLTSGKQDPVRIDMPKGTYVPTFCEQSGIEPEKNPHNYGSDHSAFEASFPKVLVRPFQNWTGDPEQEFLALGFPVLLGIELSRFQDIRVLMQHPSGFGKRATDAGARFVVDGSIRKSTNEIILAVHLVDTKTGTQIWGDTHRSVFEPSKITAFEEKISRIIATKIAGEHGIISNSISLEAHGSPPSELTTYEAILRYYEFDLTLTLESYIRALEALTHAKKNEPSCGMIWSMLAALHLDNYFLEYSEPAVPFEEAVACAEKGIQLNPRDQRSRIVLALARILEDNLETGLVEVEKAYSLNPESLFFMDSIGYLFTLLGEWERGTKLIRKAFRNNPYHHQYPIYTLWLDRFREKDYEQAFLELLPLSTYGSFWTPLARAATLGQLGRHDEGKLAVEELLNHKPNFKNDGRRLIKYHVKFDEIVERIIEGLEKVGLEVK